MKFGNKIIFIIAVILLVSKSAVLKAQDLSAFEIIENATIGLTVAPFAKAGQCLVDIDNNGYVDIYTLKYNGGDYSRIYLNDGTKFTDITNQTPLESIEDIEGIRTFTPVFADFDNDGDKDLSFGTNQNLHLLRNDNNVFTEVSEEMGFVGHKPSGFITTWYYNVGGWADYDMDGDLDCVVFQVNNDNLYLFRNDGDHFTDVAAEAGLEGTELSDETFSNPLVWDDLDNDGDPDLHGRYNILFNEGGVFRDVSDSIGLGNLTTMIYREFFDYDNDGDLDFFKVPGAPEEEPTNELWENRDGLFVNVSQETGMIMRDAYRGLSVGDFENDGDQDVFLHNSSDVSYDVLLLNEELEDGTRAFADVAEWVGITKIGDRKGGGFFDYDKDGFLDIYIPSVDHNHILYHNMAINEANWVGFILEGTLSNRDAVGSAVMLYYARGKQYRYTHAGNGWLRQDNPWVHFGIGYETSIDSVVIRWPLGYKQTLTDVEINQYHNVKEPDLSSVKSFTTSNSKPTLFQLEQNYPNPFNPTTRIDFSLKITANVELTIFDINGNEIRNLINTTAKVGNHSAVWDGRDNAGDLVTSGIYFYRLKVNNFVHTKKLTFLK
ncbi:VCBS repeat-containing protein [candidate division KSB1 bacterium]|nr:VCBS repeat-containing protein [candidate division KSB1 bacterium]